MLYNPYHIKTLDDFLKNQILIRRFFNFIKLNQNIGEIKTEKTYSFSMKEQYDYLVHALTFAKIITSYDWNKNLSSQIGHRYVEFKIKGNKLLEIYNRVYGNNGIIKKETLELISKDISKRINPDKLHQILTEDLKVPETMFDVESNENYTIFYILSYYSTSPSDKDNEIAIKIINKFLHPLFFRHEDIAQRIFFQYKNWLKLDDIQIDYNDIVLSLGKKRKNLQPYTFTKDKDVFGYLKLYKEGKVIKISKQQSRKFKLVKTMLTSLGLERNVHDVFDNIKISGDDSWCPEEDRHNFDKKIKIIKDTLRRVRETKELKGRITFKINRNKETVELNIV